jgi:hypothetical protein
MAGATDFAKMVPGFDFLQGLMQNAGSALPNMGHWIAPTLDPDELEKRIEELRTVQFWLEQNARMLSATIQALEVQRMTLSTLKTMNLPVGDIAEAFKLKPAAAPPAAAKPAPEPAPAPAPEAAAAPAKKPASKPAAKTASQPGVADPMQWWGALTQQFTQLAANALKDSTASTGKNIAKNIATEMVKQSFEAAGSTLKKAAAAPAKALGRAAGKTTHPASRPSRKR